MQPPTEPSTWAPKQTEPKTAIAILDERYADRHDPDDLDRMVVLPQDQLLTEDALVPAVEQSGEVQKPVENAGYDIAANDMIQRAPNLNETQQFFMSKAFLDALIASVERGEVTVGGKVIDVKAFKSQLDGYIAQSKLPVEERETDPFRYIPSVGGMRDAFRRLLGEEGKATRFADALKDMKFSDDTPEVAVTSQSGSLQAETSQMESPDSLTKTLEEEIAELPIEAQRAITEYLSRMSFADRNEITNGRNRDSEDSRRDAERVISTLPSAMKDLAKRKYEQEKGQ